MTATGVAGANAAQAAPTVASLSRLSIEELADIEISSVSKRPERLAEAAASVFVITADEIRRFGATTLAEALRLAPNLQVARVNAHSHAITARGFNSSSANKLLVMIDGRSVYTPLHAGVFWDALDVVLADVDRIEVISGPGGALWGANAVNGIINILTRSAADTAGTLAAAAAGTSEDVLTLRHGLRFSNGGVRGHAKHVRGEGTERADGTAAADDWERTQAGFRADWGRSESAWTLQGDVYEGHTYGLEAWGRVQVHDRWRVGAGAVLLRQRFAFAPGSADPGLSTSGGNDPELQFSLRSSHELSNDWTLDLGLRAVDALPNPSVPSHVAVDARLAGPCNAASSCRSPVLTCSTNSTRSSAPHRAAAKSAAACR
ncbi:TonB-dependent receptor plug domain-containing protein [Piscinibacter sp.]|uniref:TonB-dependent receptor plug domain-containing protein n=1 Tax=Piscinibacter sp. TaxID=1903157 RepID=UPI002D80F3C0|nr:TonB-dependent receptor [Albitalea sp.]